MARAKATANAYTTAPRAKALPAMALRGTLTVIGRNRIMVSKDGRHEEVVEVGPEGIRETLRWLAQRHFGTGGMLRKSRQSAAGCMIYMAFR